MDETERFLRLFKSLEDKMISLSGLSGGFVSFSRALDRVHAYGLNPLVADDENYQFLKTASDLRNILSHENSVCIPDVSFNDKFEGLVNEIINPLTALDIATKAENIVYATKTSALSSIAELMVRYHLSHVPIVEKGIVIGVFSSTTFFQYFYQNQSLKADKDSTIADFVDLTGYDSHLNESFVFASVSQKASSLLKYFLSRKPGEKKVSCVFLTKSGNNKEKLEGLITEADLLKLPIYERKLKGN
jgi:CBS domain-containing protein